MARIYWVKVDGQRIGLGSLSDMKALAQRAANALGKAVQVGYEDGAPPELAGPIRARRNPVMRGYDYTGEEWMIKGVAPNGRPAVSYARTRAEAESVADYLHANRKWRALTVRRVTAPAKRRR